MKLHDLKPNPGSHHRKKRIGRGPASGQGTTAGKGTKGQKAREGFKMIPGFEGGQIRMIKRLPYKRGFKNPFRVEYETFNVGLLARRFGAEAQIDLPLLESSGMRSHTLPIKILGDGELKVSITVIAHKFTRSAREKIEAAGGTVIEMGVKEPRGKWRPIDADDVTITHGEARRRPSGTSRGGRMLAARENAQPDA